MVVRGVLLVTTLALTCFMMPSEAVAFDHELQLGGNLFYAQQFIDEETRPPGGGIGFHGRYGLNDWIAIAFETAWAGHSYTLMPKGVTVLRQLVTASVGVHYAIDVFRFLPYISLLIGASTTIQEGVTAVAFLLDAGGGVDWMITDDLSFGISATYQFTVGEEIVPARLCVSVRLSWHRLFARSDPRP